ncbi:MAG: hypothetical protein LQ343_007223 [Gyalolechia ehrenbergii]|nr:MAG: hypothetical protein LQ343_007223 [Gyalolechia ehrenbergii]
MAALMQDTKLQLPVSCDPPGPHNPPEQLVFGATGHIGRSVVKAALSHNDLVTAVGRLHDDTITSIRSSFQSFHDECLPLLCDVRIRSTVDAVVQKSITHWGRVDIIANCTGYGVIGACEDQDDYDIRNQFETNFFGTVNIIHASLPYFRTRHPPISNQPQEDLSFDEQEPLGGRYLIFSSTSGALGIPGLGPYSATKHAVEGLIESMLYETHAFNIKATLVEPGHLRRDDADTPPLREGSQHAFGPPNHPAHSDHQQTPHGYQTDNPPDAHSTSTRTKSFTHFLIKQTHPSSPYADPTSPALHARRMVQWLGDGNRQPSSAVRSAELVWMLGHCRFPPLRLLLGGFAVESVRDRLRCVIEEIEDWKHLGFGEEGAAAGDGGGVEMEEDKSEDEGDGDGDGEMQDEEMRGTGEDAERTED